MKRFWPGWKLALLIFVLGGAGNAVFQAHPEWTMYWVIIGVPVGVGAGLFIGWRRKKKMV